MFGPHSKICLHLAIGASVQMQHTCRAITVQACTGMKVMNMRHMHCCMKQVPQIRTAANASTEVQMYEEVLSQ